ncbi:MAG: hypothetical protein GX333_07615 [Syntrophomonadaceae bacterium]|nr:hypothetical protein [Syntrophomonadaceae bacterium]
MRLIKSKYIALITLAFFMMGLVNIGTLPPAVASDNLANIWQTASAYMDNEITIVELSDITDYNFEEIYINHRGQLLVPNADIIGKLVVSESVYYTGEITDGVYGEIGIIINDIRLGEGNFNLITNIKGVYTAHKANDNRVWIPLIADTSKDHHYKDNPLQEISIAWETQNYGWTKLNILPVSSADTILSKTHPAADLKLSPLMYDDNDNIYSDIGGKTGILTMADATTPLKITSTDLLVQQAASLTLNYADSLAKVQDSVYENHGIIVFLTETEKDISKLIIKPENKEAYFFETDYTGIAVPLLVNEKFPYNAKTNPIYREIEVAWQEEGAEENVWQRVSIKPVLKTDDFFKRAEVYSAKLELHPSIYHPDTKIIYSDASVPTGELKAKDATTITKDNLISQSGGIIRLNYADSFVTVAQKVYDINTTGYLLFELPENIADSDPRFIIKAGEQNPELVTLEGDFLPVPLLAGGDLLEEIVIAWRSDTGDWLKVTIKPIKEYKKPKVISLHPTGEIVDEQAFKPESINGKERYFLRVVFADDGGLTYDSSLIGKMHLTDIFAVGGSRQTMLDGDLLEYASKLTSEEREAFIERYLFRKEAGTASLYIPVRKLLAQANYNVEVPSGLVYYPEGVGNDLIMWSFGTIGSPQITDISIGSIAEDYDVREPILIYGDYFVGSNIDVKFNDIKAYEVRLKEQDGKYYLEVFLPRGRDKLKPGLYNILVIKNDNEIYSQTIYGSFSVVKASSMPMPEDGIRVKGEYRVGDVVSSVKTNADTLILNARYNSSYIDLDLDDLMGEDVLVRKIRLPRNWQNTTWLYTTSRWANVSVYQLQPNDNAYNNDEVELRLGRAEPSLIPTLKRGMLNSNFLSPFIEIGGENIDFNYAQVEIPYQNSDGQRIKVLRYDEDYRQWFAQAFTKDLLNAKVSFTTNKKGIYVVVE